MKFTPGIIWLYWENKPGAEPPPHVLLCHRIFHHVCRECDIRLVTPANVKDYLPDLDPRLDLIQVSNRPGTELAVKCDFIRAFLLERYGGIYVDADCIALQDFKGIAAMLGDKEFVGVRRTSAKTRHISVGLYGAIDGGGIISEYAEGLRRLLDERTTMKYADAGAMLLTPIVDRFIETVYLFPEHLIHPVVCEKQKLFLDPRLEVEDIIDPQAFCLMLFHRIFDEDLAGLDIRQLYEGDMLLSKVFRRALPESQFVHLVDDDDLGQRGA